MKETANTEQLQINFEHISNIEESFLILTSTEEALSTTINSIIASNILLDPQIVDILLDELAILKYGIQRLSKQTEPHRSKSLSCD